MYIGQTMRKEWQELFDMIFPIRKHTKKIIQISNPLLSQNWLRGMRLRLSLPATEIRYVALLCTVG